MSHCSRAFDIVPFCAYSLQAMVDESQFESLLTPKAWVVAPPSSFSKFVFDYSSVQRMHTTRTFSHCARHSIGSCKP